MWVEFVGSLLGSERFFSPSTQVFSSLQKTTLDLISFVVIQFDFKYPQLVKQLCKTKCIETESDYYSYSSSSSYYYYCYYYYHYYHYYAA